MKWQLSNPFVLRISAAFYSTCYLNTKFVWVIRLPSTYENKLTTCRIEIRYCFDISMLETFICLYDRNHQTRGIPRNVFWRKTQCVEFGGGKKLLNVFLIRQNFDLCATSAQNSRPRESVSWQTMQQLAPFKSTFFSSVVVPYSFSALT